jgi:hypothetical protein
MFGKAAAATMHAGEEDERKCGTHNVIVVDKI